MQSFNTIEDILIFAIGAEQEAADFYLRLSGQSESTEMKQVFNQYAHEELVHKTKLMKIREKGFDEMPTEQIKDMKVSDYIVDVVPGPSMSYTEVLALAMKKEKAASAFTLIWLQKHKPKKPVHCSILLHWKRRNISSGSNSNTTCKFIKGNKNSLKTNT